ncbi:MAG: hypothetical protein U0935_03605 [Pirellulales bacterium]
MKATAWICAACGGVLLVSWALPAAAASKTINPNHQDPTLAMAIHGEAVSAKLQDEAQARYTAVAKTLRTAIERESNRQINKTDPKALGDAYAATLQLRRLALQLQLLGEPAGLDFALRADVMAPQISRVAQAYAGTPEGAAFLTKVRAFLARTQPERANLLKRVVELATRNQWQEAETTFHTALDKIHAMTVFLSPDEQKPIHEPFYDLSAKITQGMNAVRIKESDAIFAERRKALAPDLKELPQQCAAVAQGLATSPTVDFQGQMLTGPQAVAALLASAQQLHVRLLKYHALSLALQGRAAGGGYTGMVPMGSTGGVTADPLVQQYVNEFPAALSAGLSKVVAADTARVAEADVAALYTAYVEAVALFSMRTGNSPVATALHTSLQQLAAKSPAVAANVTAYDEATTELLRWRNRVAASQARARLSSHPTVETPFRPAFTSKELYLGLFDATMPDFQEPRLLAAAPDILLPAVEKVVGQKATIGEWRGIGTGKNTASVLESRTYGTMKGVRGSVEPALAALRADLFLADDAPPLTLAAAAAVQSAEVGDWDQCGGTIQGLHLEAFITRLATLPDPVWQLVPWGAAPPATRRVETVNVSILPQVIVRFEMSPEWVQHRFFFSEIAATEAEAAGTAAPTASPAATAGRR